MRRRDTARTTPRMPVRATARESARVSLRNLPCTTQAGPEWVTSQVGTYVNERCRDDDAASEPLHAVECPFRHSQPTPPRDDLHHPPANASKRVQFPPLPRGRSHAPEIMCLLHWYTASERREDREGQQGNFSTAVPGPGDGVSLPPASTHEDNKDAAERKRSVSVSPVAANGNRDQPVRGLRTTEFLERGERTHPPTRKPI